jgi:hypothetical protein
MGKYSVMKELEKIEASEHKPTDVSGSRGGYTVESNIYTRRVDYPPQSYYEKRDDYGNKPSQHPDERQSFSPLRNRSGNSPNNNNRSKPREELIEKNYRRARESCERIANVLGINP